LDVDLKAIWSEIFLQAHFESSPLPLPLGDDPVDWNRTARIAARLFWAICLALPWWVLLNAIVAYVLPKRLTFWWGEHAAWLSFAPVLALTYVALLIHDRRLRR
jgi:hypothetical protein